jgi:hypothetical protein
MITDLKFYAYSKYLWEIKLKDTLRLIKTELGIVEYVCNPSYSGDGGRST